jgi:hypothetical protein
MRDLFNMLFDAFMALELYIKVIIIVVFLYTFFG